MRWLSLILASVLPGCDVARSVLPGGAADEPAALVEPQADVIRPVARPDAAASPTGARVPDATLPPPPGRGSVLGTTIAALGDPGEGGMWLNTPLVQAPQPGQVRYQGSVVAVTLRPLAAPVGAGSEISLRAMQALGAPITDLIEITVERL